MQEYHSLSFKEREEIIEKIKKTLQKNKEVAFAYVFGSFLDAPSFRDIDIAVYLKDISQKNVFDKEMKLEGLISRAVGFPLDILEVKILNFAPVGFQNNVFSRGQLLFSKDEELLSKLIEESSLEMIANAHISYQSLKELVPA